jgi:ATP-dependent Lhr-like helicase
VLHTQNGRQFWVAAERLPQLDAIYANASTQPPIKAPDALLKTEWTADSALVEIVRGRMEGVGPITIPVLAETTGLPVYAIENAMLKLEAEGFVLRGKFTPGTDETEWCARRLLARIHSYTLNRLRQEIEPVSSADFVRFLLAWQKVDPEHQVEGPQSLAAVIDQLEGFESAAAAWEGEILASRVAGYDPLWLDNLCLTGKILWARLSPPKPVSEKIKGASPIRNTPIALINRKNLSLWDPLFGHASIGDFSFSTITQSVYDFLVKRGASFFSDIVEGLNLLKSQVEESLGELVAYGLITADSYTGLRALLTPSNLRTQNAGRRKRHGAVYEMSSAGRWTLLSREASVQSESLPYEMIEKIAHILLRRYGVVFRKLLDREDFQLPWRDLLRVYRRLEARGEIRGGRFVSGFSGEQFALPEAVSTLRSIRRTKSEGTLISISAADPLNLVGIITPGGRVTAFLNNRILYRDGVPIAALESGQIRYFVDIDPGAEWQTKNALVRRVIPPQLRSYLKA